MPIVVEQTDAHVQAAAREAALRQILPPLDYADAERMGLIDMFEYDPDRGLDGLLHTLAGDVSTGSSGGIIPGGFHHEESGALAWGEVRTNNGSKRFITRVDRDHLVDADAKGRRKYLERLGEPYLARIAIGDRPKYAAHEDPKTGEITLEAAKNTMYPKEYDALAVLQAIRIAFEGRDPANDRMATASTGQTVIVNESEVPLIDGKSAMTIRLVIDAATNKIKTAIPVIKKKGGIMNLTGQQLNSHITYGMIDSKEI